MDSVQLSSTSSVVRESKDNELLKSNVLRSYFLKSSDLPPVPEDVISAERAGKHFAETDRQSPPRKPAKIPINELSSSIVASHKLMQAIQQQNSKDVEQKTEDCVSSANSVPHCRPGPSLVLTLPLLPSDSHPVVAMPQSKQRLFDEFFIIGAEPSAVESLKVSDVAYLPPSVLFQYPNLPENSDWYVPSGLSRG